jgi:hypothetical protein
MPLALDPKSWMQETQSLPNWNYSGPVQSSSNSLKSFHRAHFPMQCVYFRRRCKLSSKYIWLFSLYWLHVDKTPVHSTCNQYNETNQMYLDDNIVACCLCNADRRTVFSVRSVPRFINRTISKCNGVQWNEVSWLASSQSEDFCGSVVVSCCS